MEVAPEPVAPIAQERILEMGAPAPLNSTEQGLLKSTLVSFTGANPSDITLSGNGTVSGKRATYQIIVKFTGSSVSSFDTVFAGDPTAAAANLTSSIAETGLALSVEVPTIPPMAAPVFFVAPVAVPIAPKAPVASIAPSSDAAGNAAPFRNLSPPPLQIRALTLCRTPDLSLLALQVRRRKSLTVPIPTKAPNVAFKYIIVTIFTKGIYKMATLLIKLSLNVFLIHSQLKEMMQQAW
jgi:hypothetical protein